MQWGVAWLGSLELIPISFFHFLFLEYAKATVLDKIDISESIQIQFTIIMNLIVPSIYDNERHGLLRETYNK